jgi:hypothetical protein
MLRMRWGMTTRPLEILLTLGSAVIAATCAHALEPSYSSSSTLDSHVPPQQLHLDATIASMVKRGVIVDISTPTSAKPTTASKPTVQPALQPGHTQWRPARQGARPLAAAAPGGNSSSHIPAPPTPPASSESEPELEQAEEPIIGTPAAEIEQLEKQTEATAKDVAATSEPATSEASSDDDALAPVDELSETPAPETDAPGDPIEPEYTGPAVSDATMPPAKPLSSAPKPGSAAQTPIGEPDRIAKPDLTTTPASPEDYEHADEPAPTTVAPSLPPLTQNQRALREKVRRVLKHYYDRPLSSVDRSPWEVMHMMLSYEVHSRILQANRQPITAVGWLCFNQPCENRSLLYLNEEGDMRVKVGPALQGHHGQLLALLAQARVRSDYPMKVEGQDFTVANLIEVEKATCYPKTELTFKLIGLQRYLDINARWVNDQGMQWDFPTLVREELRQPVRTAACGGTHRLSGLALAVKKRRSSGLPVDGVYAEAEKHVANYQNYAYSLQNPDGSFSTSWFKGPGKEADIDRRLKTTGHTLEWLLYAGSQQQLTHYRTVRAVNYLSNIMWANRTRDWEAGPLGHAIHALVLYDRMAFSKYDGIEQSAPTPVVQRSRVLQQGRSRR